MLWPWMTPIECMQLHYFSIHEPIYELLTLGRMHFIVHFIMLFGGLHFRRYGNLDLMSCLAPTPAASIAANEIPPALSSPSPHHPYSCGDVRLLLSSPPPCRWWGAYRARREVDGMGWQHRPASLLRAALSLRIPISSSPKCRAAGGFARLPVPWRQS